MCKLKRFKVRNELFYTIQSNFIWKTDKPTIDQHSVWGFSSVCLSKAMCKVNITHHSIARFTRQRGRWRPELKSPVGARGVEFLTVFQLPFSPEVDDVEYWNEIANLVTTQFPQISNFKKIGSKLWPWQCHRVFIQTWPPWRHQIC